MVEQLLPHVPLHVSSHHVSLIAHVILAQGLDHVHDKQPGRNGNQGSQHRLPALPKQSSGERSQNLGISQIHQTDHRRAHQVKIKDRLIRLVVADKFSDRIHILLLCQSFCLLTVYYNLSPVASRKRRSRSEVSYETKNPGTIARSRIHQLG